MNKVECQSDRGNWYESTFGEEDFLYALEGNNSGFYVHYRIVDDKGNVVRLFNLEGSKLVEDTTAKVEPNMEHKGYYYNPVAVPWHEAVEDIIKNDAVYLCKYTDSLITGSDFRVTHTKHNQSTELGFVDDDGDDQEFKVEHYWFTAKWHKEMGKVQPKPQGKLKDGLYFTHSGDKKPLEYYPGSIGNASSGWIPVEGCDAVGNYSVVKDGVVVRTYSIVEG